MPTSTPDQRRGGPDQVDQHRQHQEQVDLSEREVLPHRLQGERTAGQERDQPPRRGPAERAAYHHHDRRQAATDAPVHSAAASHAGSSASGTITTAANGG